MNERTKTLINALMDWRQKRCDSWCADCPLNNDLCDRLVDVADNIIANIGEFTPIGESGSYGTLGEYEGLDKE